MRPTGFVCDGTCAGNELGDCNHGDSNDGLGRNETHPYRNEEIKAVERQEILARAHRCLDSMRAMRRTVEKQPYYMRVKRDDIIGILKGVEEMAQALLERT